MLSLMGLSSVRNWRTLPTPVPRDVFHQQMMFQSTMCHSKTT